MIINKTLASGCFGENIRVLNEEPQHHVQISFSMNNLSVKNWYHDLYRVALNIEFENKPHILYSRSLSLNNANKLLSVLKEKLRTEDKQLIYWTIQNLEIYDDCDDYLEYEKSNRLKYTLVIDGLYEITLATSDYIF
tara:strand:+ start:948 stop:1358 length:411 start_codon:yes stop_codon:yes gene_type:complete